MQNLRKVIFATNIAETSITIPGIKYVVDCGKVKCRKYKASSAMDTLKIENISKAQAFQRSGRAGRETRYKLKPIYFILLKLISAFFYFILVVFVIVFTLKVFLIQCLIIQFLKY